MSKYINPFTDMGFKRIFGQEEHKQLLIAFLNSLFEGEMVISDLEYRDKEHLSSDNNGKSFVSDIYCTLKDGEHVLIEMQNRGQSFFEQRSILYAARALEKQSRRGNDWTYAQLKAVYTISFLNFNMDELPQQLLTDGVISDKRTSKQINKFVRMIYIQLPQMTKELEECDNNFERWIYLLKNIETMKTIPDYLKDAMDDINYFENVVTKASMTSAELERYEESLKLYRDEIAVADFYRKEGREEGREEERLRIVQSLRDMGMDADIINKVLSNSEN